MTDHYAQFMPKQAASIIPASGSKMAKYKTSLWKHFELTGTWQMENRCHFAHGKHELRKQTDVSNSGFVLVIILDCNLLLE